MGAGGALVMNEGSHGGGVKPVAHVNRRPSGVVPKSPGVAAAGVGDEPPGAAAVVGAKGARSGVEDVDARGVRDGSRCGVPHPARSAAGRAAHTDQRAHPPTVATSRAS